MKQQYEKVPPLEEWLAVAGWLFVFAVLLFLGAALVLNIAALIDCYSPFLGNLCETMGGTYFEAD